MTGLRLCFPASLSTETSDLFAGQLRYSNLLEQCSRSFWSQHVSLPPHWQDKRADHEYCRSHQGLDADWPLCCNLQGGVALTVITVYYAFLHEPMLFTKEASKADSRETALCMYRLSAKL